MNKSNKNKDFLDTDHLISLDEVINILNSEIQWCYKNDGYISEEYRNAFII